MKTRGFRHGRLSQQVATELEQLLKESFPNPGDRWPAEPELADQFGVSRIVVREAVKMLEDRGLLEVSAGRGTFTRKPSLDLIKASLARVFASGSTPVDQAIEEILELRQVLEETAAALAAIRATDEDLKAMDEALAGMSDDGNSETTASDLKFHLAVVNAAHNRLFAVVLEPLTQVFIEQIALANFIRVGADLHRHVYREIRSRNPVGARQAMRRLFRATRADVSRAMNLALSSASS